MKLVCGKCDCEMTDDYLLEWCRGDLVLYFKTLRKIIYSEVEK